MSAVRQRPHPARLMISGRQSAKTLQHYVASCAVLVLQGGGLVACRDCLAVLAASYACLDRPNAGTLRILAAPVLRVCRAAGDQNEDEFALARHDLRLALAVYFAGELVI
ncbi:hypothetical protein [Pelagimonas varians]|uniref:Uncharacterized protein n=1 Tax=Pelagimonas varians TaxID=696760 RepID=A0A238K0R1_9RHOB|nr:hypothetical protein [Pelagimonas varians]PYG33108.1 hypothetical protein C8N36_102103 [Pelagimonas varians]SMX35702.1 hypothetical protein PEV8663_00565 [Pelagimonas varians]